jgi:hypothetical protein
MAAVGAGSTRFGMRQDTSVDGAAKGAKAVIGVYIVVALVITSMLLPHVGYSPMWDGRIYADCIAAAARHLTPGSLRCAGHASHAYAGLTAIIQSIDPGSFPLLLLTNAVLLAISCAAFARLVGLVFPAADHRLDRALLVALFAAQPTLLAAVVQPGLDLAVVPAFLWCVVYALEYRRVAASVVGCLLMFTKETGVLLYAVFIAWFVVWHTLGNDTGQPRRRELVRLTPLLVPLLLFGAYLLYRATLPNQPILWSGGTIGRPIVLQLLIPTLDLYQLSYAAIVLVLSFGWLFTSAIAIDALVGGVRMLERKPSRPVTDADGRRLLFLVVLTIVTGYALTRFTTFGNPRYVLVPRLLLLVPGYAALLRLGARPLLRQTMLGAAAVLTLVSAVRTVDPVSRSLYGTFAVGDHRMLRMTSITGECCGFGRDQLVYNLEFAWLQRALRAALTSVVPATSSSADSLVVVVPDSAAGTLVGAWVAGPNEPAGTSASVAKFITLVHSDLTSGRHSPNSAVLIAMPTVDFTRALHELATAYTLDTPYVVDVHGYRIWVYRMSRRRSS